MSESLPPEARELRAGSFVTNGVRLLRPLAEGGMGRVWVAEHLGLRTEVVVKLMAREMAERDDGATRFTREAEVAAAIKSPHVVQVFDHGTTAGVPYIVMELLEGKDLGAVLHERGRLEPSEAAAVVVQVGKALSRAHKAGILHRDVKPENIFLCAGEAADGEAVHVKLLDFGTAKQSARPTGKETLPGEIMGTPYYMSPEQSVGATVDPRTDIWSLGVVAFEMLTGTKPFEGSSVGAIALAIHGPLPRVSDRAHDLPPALDAWFARACAQVPQDRFATVREMTSAFVEALTGQAPVEHTESICLVPPRRISVRPQESDDLKKTLPTSIEPSVPPPPKHDSIPALVASLPDREAVHRPTRIAASVVALAAAALMAAIVVHRPTAEAPAVVAASPPPALPSPPPSPSSAGPSSAGPSSTGPSDEPLSPASGIAPTSPAAPPVVVARKAPPSAAKKARARKDAGAGAPPSDDDLARLIQAAETPQVP